MAKRKETPKEGLPVQEAVELLEDRRMDMEAELINRGVHAVVQVPVEEELRDERSGAQAQNTATNKQPKSPDAPRPSDAYLGWVPDPNPPAGFDELLARAIPLELLDVAQGVVFKDKQDTLYYLDPMHPGEYILRRFWGRS